MTRASAYVGLLLGVVSIVGGVLGYLEKGSAASLIAGGVGGLLIVVGASAALRRKVAGQVLMLAVSFALLGRFVPAYFLAPRIWPSLVVIALSSVTFGLGILGLVLDRYRRPEA